MKRRIVWQLPFVRTPKLGSTPAPGVAGRASRPVPCVRKSCNTQDFAPPLVFSARARKTAPGAGALPFPFWSPVVVLACLLLVVVGDSDSRGADSSARVVAAETAGRGDGLLENPGFEVDELKGWSLVTVGDAVGQMECAATLREGETNSHSLQLTVLNPGPRCGVSNHGTAGLKVKSGNWYDLTFQARTERRENARGYGLTVSLESPDGGQVFARTTIPEVGGDWQQYSVALHAYASSPNARLVITMSEPGTIWLDDVSLSARNSQSR